MNNKHSESQDNELSLLTNAVVSGAFGNTGIGNGFSIIFVSIGKLSNSSMIGSVLVTVFCILSLLFLTKYISKDEEKNKRILLKLFDYTKLLSGAGDIFARLVDGFLC